MLVEGRPFKTIWTDADPGCIHIIDQTLLPHRFEIRQLTHLDEVVFAITHMQVRGAPLIGAAAAYGICLALDENPSNPSLAHAMEQLGRTRPTAVNLQWALDRMRSAVLPVPEDHRARAAYLEAGKICEEDVRVCRRIGEFGLDIIRELHRKQPDRPVNILTHCNAGWLATIDWGTATSPIYHAQVAEIPVHVWVDETRPRNQGAALTCFELDQQDIPHTLVVDNAGGYLMQQGRVDLVITGTDRTARNGDVANKIGTYLKALAAKDNGIPFYVALPSSTIDWHCTRGAEIPIEHRSTTEITHLHGIDSSGNLEQVRVSPPGSPAENPAFDITPAELVDGLITERGIVPPNEAALSRMFPEFSPHA